MEIPVKVIEKTETTKTQIKEIDGKNIINVVKENKALIENMVNLINTMFGGGKEGIGDLFQLAEYMEDAKKVYIIIEKEEKGV
jgi:hypothetical protein